jgi:hypothetical protein
MAKPETPKSAATLRAERDAQKEADVAAKAKRNATEKQRQADRAKADALQKEQRDVKRELRDARWFSAKRAALTRKLREIEAGLRTLRGKKYD